MSKTGFVYIWHDTKRNRFYLGSHLGSTDDGYVGSGSDHFQKAYNARPHTFKRRIIESNNYSSHKELQKREEYWLSMIDDKELGNKYYNLKKFAGGGDIVSNLSPEKRKLHRERSIAVRERGRQKWIKENPDRVKELAKNARASWSEESYKSCIEKQAKTAKLTKNGKEVLVKNVSAFCQEHNINYGNMKTVLRGKRKTCQGWSGSYV